MAKLAGISADNQASINEIQDAFDEDQVKELKAIVEKAPKPLDQGLPEVLNKETRKVASDSATQVLTGCFY